MSEVHIYSARKLVTTDGNNITYAGGGPDVVMKSAYDAALAREAALQARLTVADQRVDDLCITVNSWGEVAEHLQSELTKARELLNVSYQLLGLNNSLVSYRQHMEDIGAFTSRQPAPAAKEPCGNIYETRTSKSAKAPEGLRPDQIVEVYGGGFQQIGSVARTDWRNVEKWRIADMAPAAKDSACTSCDGSGEYIDALGDWRGYCKCPAGVAAKGKQP